MNAIELVRKDTQETVGWKCSACGEWALTVVRGLCDEEAKRMIDECCSKICRKCGGETKYPGRLCGACETKREAERELARYEKAKKVKLDEYEGEMLYFSDERVGREGYVDVSEIDDALERFVTEHKGEPSPPYAWATSTNKVQFNLGDTLLDVLNDEAHEDASDWVKWKLVEAAQVMVDHALENVTTYWEDHSVAVLLPPVVLDTEPKPFV